MVVDAGRRRRRATKRRSPPSAAGGVEGRVLVVLRSTTTSRRWKSFRNLADVHVLPRGRAQRLRRARAATGWSSPRHAARGDASPALTDEARDRTATTLKPTRETVVKDPRDVIIAPGRHREVLRAPRRQRLHVPGPPDASKPEIRDAVEAIFGVRVLKVNTLNRHGKRLRNRGQRHLRQAARHQAGHRHPRRGRRSSCSRDD